METNKTPSNFKRQLSLDPWNFGCRPVETIKMNDSIVQRFGWQWDDKTRQYVVVKTDKIDLQQQVDAGLGSDIPSVIKKQPGSTALERLDNAINSGLVNVTTDLGDQYLDMTQLPTDKLEAELAIRKAKAGAAQLNETLGLKDKDALTFEDYFKGEAKDIIKKYIDDKVAELTAAKAKGETKDE